MSRRSGAVLLVIGIGALLGGAYAALRPLPSPMITEKTCGSAFSPSKGDSPDVLSRSFLEIWCADDIRNAKIVSILLLVLAFVLILAGVVQLTARDRYRPTTPIRLLPDGDSSVADALERIAELKRSGALTDAEFDAAKRRILGETKGAPGD